MKTTYWYKGNRARTIVLYATLVSAMIIIGVPWGYFRPGWEGLCAGFLTVDDWQNFRDRMGAPIFIAVVMLASKLIFADICQFKGSKLRVMAFLSFIFLGVAIIGPPWGYFRPSWEGLCAGLTSVDDVQNFKDRIGLTLLPLMVLLAWTFLPKILLRAKPEVPTHSAPKPTAREINVDDMTPEELAVENAHRGEYGLAPIQK